MPATPMTHRPADERIRDVYRETIGPLYAYVSRRCAGERALAEDVVQETWLRAVNAWRLKGLPDTPAAWLTTVAHNLLVNHYRRRPMVPLSDIPSEAILAVVDNGFDTKSTDVARLIQWGLARLPRSQAGLLEAFHLEQRSVAAIALELRVSERAVEGRLRRARRKLRQLIERVTHTKGER